MSSNISSDDTTVPMDEASQDIKTEESERDTSPLLRTGGSLIKAHDLNFMRRMRRKLEQKILDSLKGQIPSFGDKKVSMDDIIEMERLYRLQQKYYFVSLLDVSYTVSYTSAKDHQATIWNTLPPVLFWKRFVSKTIQTKTADILKNVTFYMRPGTMTLLLGAPGSGKTTLFNLISDRLEKPRGVVSGEVKFNGISLPKKLHQRDVGYVTQRDDIHLPRLTVEETLRFATECQFPGNPPDYIKAERISLILSGLGLEHRAGSIVGDDMLRGISGGEKRRLSIGIEYTKIPSVMLYDEPTTGLDANAALNFAKILKMADGQAEPSLVALLQPSYEIFCLFDQVMLLSQGEVAFFGGRKQCLDFFEERGYVCDLTTNPAEFLQEVVENPAKYRASKELREQIKQRVRSRKHVNDDLDGIEESYNDQVDIDKEYTREDFIADYNREYKPQVIATINAEKKKYLSKSYLDAINQNVETQEQSNNTAASLLDKINPTKIAQRIQRDRLEKSEQARIVHYNDEQGYSAGFFKQLYLHVWRSSLMLIRNHDLFTGRLIISVVIAFILGSLFWDTSFDQRSIRTRGGLIFFIMSYVAFTSLSFLPLFAAEKKIFYFQKRARYFRSLSYHLGSTIVELPVALLEATLLGSITYWMTGLNSDPSRFFFFLLLLFVTSHLFSTTFKYVGVLFSTLDAATTFATTVLCVLFLMSGYTIPVDSIRPYFIWLYWISPFHYAFEGFMINILDGQEYYCKDDQLVPSSTISNFTTPYPDGWSSSQICPYTNGSEYLKTFGFWGDSALKMRWADLGVLLGMTLLTHIGIILSYIFSEPTKPRPRIVEEPEIKPQDIELNVRNQQEAECEEDEEGSGGQAARFIFKNICYSVKQKRRIPKPQYLIKRIVKRRKGVEERYVESKVQQSNRLQLLTDISGRVLPGQLLALMGASGAGKSTLLDVLSRRKTSGKISGDILINGQKMNKCSNRLIGYVEQKDIHIETSTVQEALEFSAACRLPKSRTSQQKKELVSSILNLLELESIKKRAISTLSQEQKKRVTLGVEMAGDPILLFIDEPTSGLDSRGAEIVMKTIRRIVDAGRVSVICTIHQPSTPVFELFTHLLLIKKGGQMIYFGEIHDQTNNVKFGKLLKYFSDIGLYCPPHRNPADWMLEITSGDSGTNNDENSNIAEERTRQGIKKWMDEYKQRRSAKKMEERIQREVELRAKWSKIKQQQQQQQQQNQSKNVGLSNEDEDLSQRETVDDASEDSKGKDLASDSTSTTTYSDYDNSDEEEEDEVQNILRTDDVDATSLDFASIFQNSDLYSNMIQSVDDQTIQDQSKYNSAREKRTRKQRKLEKRRYASGFSTQLYYTLLRSVRGIWRDPLGFRQRILTSIFLGLLFGLLFFGLTNGVVDTSLKVSLIYFSLLFTTLGGISSLPKIISERAVFYRERSSMTYRTIVYMLVLILSELPFIFLSSITFSVPVYWMANLNPNASNFFIFVLGITLMSMLSLGFVQTCTVLAPDVGTANTIVGAALSAFDLFAGFLIARNMIPNYWVWMNYVSFLAYPIEALSVNELRGMRIECRGSEWLRVPVRNSTSGEELWVCPVESGEEILEEFGLKEDRMWIDLGVMGAWWVVFLVITLLSLKFVKHIQR